MMLSLVSPTVSAIFAEELSPSSSSTSGSSVTDDTYSSSDTTSTTSSPAPTPAPEKPLFTVQSNQNSVTTATYDTYADGEYTIAYQVTRTNASGKVVASNIFKYASNATTPGQMIIKNGQYHFLFASENAYLFTQFKATQSDQTQEAKVTLNDGSTTKGTVSFDVYDLSKEINIAYTFNDSSYNERLTLDPSTLKVIDKTPPVTTVKPATGTETSIAYTVLKDGTNETSMMDNYLQKPAKLITNGSKKYIQLTLNQSSWIKALQTDIDKDGIYTDVGLISSDTASNTRLVQFEADSLSQNNTVIYAKVHVVMPAGSIPNMGAYDQWYTVQFHFDKASIPLTLADGQYSLKVATLKEKTDDSSSMANYFGNPATIVAKDGQYKVIMNIVKDSSVITSLKTESNEVLTETTIVSADSTANTRIVTFPIDSLEQIVKAQVHIKTAYAGSVYEADYPIRFKFDTTSIAPVILPVPDSSTNINYQVFKDNSSEISVMDKYVVKPATLITKDEKKYIQLTLKNSAWIKSLQVDGNGGKNYTDVTVISTDSVANTRVIQFEVNHLSKANPVLNAYTHVVIPPEFELNYDHYYTIQFKFDETQLPEPTTPTVPTPVVLENGTYRIPMSTLKSTSDAVSTMGNYFDSNVTLTAIDGNYQATLKVIKDSSVITAFKTDQNGTLTDTQIISEDTTNNTRIVTFPVTNLSSPLHAQVHIKTAYAGSVYEADYPIRLQFDLANMTVVPGTPEEPTTPTVPTNPTEVADGKYSASFIAYKFKEKEVSVMNEYVLHPATVIKRGGKLYVQITLKESDWIKTFKVGGTDAQVISTSGNQRVVQFAVKDLSETIVVNTHVVVPGLEIGGVTYDHTYNVDFKFGSLGSYEEPKDSATTTPIIPLDYDKLSNGKYKMPFQVVVPNSASGAISPVQRFLAKDQPAQFVVENDQRYVFVTLQDAKEVKTLRVSENGTYQDAEVTATDEQANTKTVRFSVADFKKNIPAQLVTTSGVSIASTSADNENANETIYDFEFKFDTANVTKDNTDSTAVTEKGNNNIADGEYTASYRILQNGSEQDSVLTDYVDQTAHLTAKEGKVYATITINNSQAVPKFQTDFAGKYTDPTMVTATSNARTVTFEVPNLDQKLSIFSQVSIPDQYMNNEKIGGQIIFDRNTLQADRVEEAVTAPVQDTQPTVSTPPSNPITEVQATPEQKYTIAYKVYKNQSGELSVMNDYVDKKATLIEKDGKTFAQITLDKSSWMPVLQVKQNGTLQDVEVISTSGDQRVVQFEVNDLSQKISAYTHVIVPGLVIGGVAYDHWYTVQFQFDLSSKKKQ
ncbi:NEAT domain-containing protein [Paenibacillus nicotianae]|uniref:NEAT domain-containing protein n=1 Tax=Paenibacillus nicotianae TaxID=1526551 RepID=A0ABW4UQL8_9BACL